ncbi:MAG: PorT family protein [Prevotella sp.]|jgi:predicted porin|nr:MULTISPECIES: porin family protein [unclassified Prevotella]MCH3985928.1 PorT family protein [Prevotella sp.]MCH3991609.1 PorT family protein [Prevotella sp.]MCH4018775.1 PorT family protein [Prevotella sp.]MCH4101005.1 PorT family protein [Prevotella sp.]MCI1292461.1 PorT family protein [Prevotella sp.]
MKKMILMAAVLLSSMGAFAQAPAGTFTLQPKVGVNVSTLTNLDANSKAGFVGGVEGQYQFDDLFGLSLGVNYSQQGAKWDISNNTSYSQKLDYINLPILANVYVVKGLAVKVGVQPGFLVDKHNSPYDPKTVDLSIPVGLSYEYDNFVLDARYNWGVTKVSDGMPEWKNDKVENNNSRNSVFQFTLGYKFNL